MRRVQIESPYAPQTLQATECTCKPRSTQSHDVNGALHSSSCDTWRSHDRRVWELARNRRYLAACLADCIRRGETPYASHGLLTMPGVLDDTKPAERARGIAAGLAMREAMDATVFYIDLGWSIGMRVGEAHAVELRDDQESDGFSDPHAIEIRKLGTDWDVSK